MRSLLILMSALLILVSCSLKEAVDNDFNAKTNITPFTKTKKLDETYKTIIVRIPLTQASMGYIDREEMLGREEMDARKKGIIARFVDKIKLGTYNLAVWLNLTGKIKYSYFYDFEDSVKPEYIRSAKVRRVFFSTEDCRKNEVDCNGSDEIQSNFNFVDQFLVNISNYVYSTPEEGELEELDQEDFKDILRRSYEQETADSEVEKIEYNLEMAKNGVIASEFKTDEELLISIAENTSAVSEFNIVRFTNNAPDLSKDTIMEYKKGFFKIKLNEKNTRTRKVKIRNFLRTPKFDHLVKRIRIKNDGVTGKLKSGVTLKSFMKYIEPEKNERTSKMVIFRLNSKIAATKDYLESKEYKKYLKYASVVGDSIYAELRDDVTLAQFEEIQKNDQYFDKHLDLYKFQRCDNKNCLDLKVREVNLVPLLSRNSKLKIDSILSIKGIGTIDFKYNGFIEVEMNLTLPL